jgi:hypothetical protein
MKSLFFMTFRLTEQPERRHAKIGKSLKKLQGL